MKEGFLVGTAMKDHGMASQERLGVSRSATPTDEESKVKAGH